MESYMSHVWVPAYSIRKIFLQESTHLLYIWPFDHTGRTWFCPLKNLICFAFREHEVFISYFFFKDSCHNGDGGCIGAGDGEDDAGHDGGDADADGAGCDDGDEDGEDRYDMMMVMAVLLLMVMLVVMLMMVLMVMMVIRVVVMMLMMLMMVMVRMTVGMVKITMMICQGNVHIEVEDEVIGIKRKRKNKVKRI